MRVFSALCEFNPFHFGHKHFLTSMRDEGADYVICLMSGNFVQRGAIALCDKYERALAAVKNGADLVLELPLPFCLSSAQSFAGSAVEIMNRLSVVTDISFGCCSSIGELSAFSDYLETEEAKTELSRLMDSGISYPDAVSALDKSGLLKDPNNILAVEYIKRLSELNSPIVPHAVKRLAVAHNENTVVDNITSASNIRRMIEKGESASRFLPENLTEIASFNTIERAFLMKLRNMTPDRLKTIAGVHEGLEYRIAGMVRTASSYSELLENIKTNRYTYARINRVLMCAFLGITEEMQKSVPSFLNVLAADKKGLEIASAISENSDIKLIFRHSDSYSLSREDRSLYELMCSSDDIYGLAFEKIRLAAYDKTKRFTVYNG